MELCDICIKYDDKCNHCHHCDQTICQFCSKFMGPKVGFYCDWNPIDGTICSDCLDWTLTHSALTERSGWKRDPYASDEENEFDPSNPK